MAALSVVAALALALALSAPWSRRPAPVPSPTTPATARAETLVVQSDTQLMTVFGEVRNLPRVTSAQGSFPSLAFSPDGSRLAYSDEAIHVMVVGTGARRTLAPCRTGCPVAWAPDGRSVLTITEGRLTRIDLSRGSTTSVSVPAGWRVIDLDVDAEGRLVLAGMVGTQAGLMTMGLDGSRPSVVDLFGASAWVTEPRWSPDGRTIAFVHRAAALGTDGASTVDAAISLRTVDADGSAARTVVGLGSCYCVGGWPGLDWSPGGRIAVIGMLPDTALTAYLATLDGTLTPVIGANGALAWRPGNQSPSAAERQPGS